VFTAVVKNNAETTLINAEESGYKIFPWVQIKPYRRLRTAVVGTFRFLFPLLGIFVVIPLPIFIIPNLSLLFTSPITVFNNYLEIFGLIYFMILLMSAMIFVMLFIRNPHEKKSGLGVEANAVIQQITKSTTIAEPLQVSGITKSSIIAQPIQVSGITNFKWESVDSLVYMKGNDVTVIFTQPKSWWEKLITYPGLRLIFASDREAQEFYKTANDFIHNLESNQVKDQQKQGLTFVERQRMNGILYGPSDN